MDKHLNFFRFFNGSALEYWEDNMSRAFALCLKNDSLFLSVVLRNILSEEDFKKVFSSEFPDNKIVIDLQRKVQQLENYDCIYAVAASGFEIDCSSNQKPRKTENPETDLLITYGEICILFEFKRTNEDCTAQLKRQAQIVKANSSDDAKIVIRDYNWKKIITDILDVITFEKRLNISNQILINFKNYIEYERPEWFPEKYLSNITPSENDNQWYYLYERLNSLKEFVYGKDKVKQIGDRFIISVEHSWANELHVDYEEINQQKYIVVIIYPGDTKAQGWSYFKDLSYDWNNRTICSYKLKASYYLKFSHFNSGVTWLNLTEKESKITHNKSFFEDWSGRYKKEFGWNKNFCNPLAELIPDWKERSHFKECFEKSKRTYFDLSIGTKIRVLIPYEDAQKLDNSNSSENELADIIRKIHQEISDIIDGQ